MGVPSLLTWRGECIGFKKCKERGGVGGAAVLGGQAMQGSERSRGGGGERFAGGRTEEEELSMEENTARAHAVRLVTCVSLSPPGFTTFSKLPTFKCTGFVPGKTVQNRLLKTTNLRLKRRNFTIPIPCVVFSGLCD